MNKVLVTGADGFIGSHLVENLLARGYDVRCFCLYNSIGSWGWLDSLPLEQKSNLEVILGDIRDPLSVREAMRNCSHVFHLAALIAIPYSYIAPSSYIDTNVHGTLNVVQAARDLGVERVIHTSTSETYGTAQFVPITEDHPQVGQSPYAASKIAADQIALSYWRSFETPVSVLRPFNTYGPRQSSRAVIPSIISQISSGKSQIKLGSITPTRDFIYVKDTCDAFISLANCQEAIGKIVNASSNFEISIKETVNLISEVMDKNITIITDDNRIRPEKSEVNRLYGDNSLLKKLTSWQPNFSGLKGFREGLRITKEWFTQENNLKFYKPDRYVI